MYKCVFYLLIVFFVSCTHKEKRSNKVETIKNEFISFEIPLDLTVSKQLNLSSFADSITYIALETKKECLISKIKDIQLANDKFIISTDKKEILCFNSSGKFVNKVGKKGKGPEEYYSLLDYVVMDSLVYVLDYGSRIAVYQLSGVFLKYISLPMQASRLMLLNDNHIACYMPDYQANSSEDIFSWLILNASGDSIGCISTPQIRNNTAKAKKISNHFVLSNISSRIKYSFKEAFNDTLYFINTKENRIESYACIEQGIHKIDFNGTFEDVIKSKHNMRVNKIIDLPNYLFLSYKCKCAGINKIHHAVIDKDSRHFYNLRDQNDEENIINDIDFGVGFNNLILTSDNKLIGTLDAYIAKERFSSVCKEYHKGANKKHELEIMANRLDENDNPVLILIKMKGQK